MKKLLTVAVLSLGLLAMSGSRASAVFFFHRCCNSCFTLHCKQYNAFTPTCSGTVCCDGCCPFNFGNACAPASPPCLPDCGPGCADGSCTVHLPPGGPAPAQTPPAAGSGAGAAGAGGGSGSGDFKAPNPSPLPGGTPMSHAYPYGYAPVNRVGYYPGYAPAYAPQGGYGPGYGYGYPQANMPAPYPYGYGPMMNYGAAAPAYWYGR